MVFYKMRKSLKALFFISLLSATFFLVGKEPSLAQENRNLTQSMQRATICWVDHKDSAYELFFSFFDNGKWSRAKQLTDSRSVNYLPTLADDGNNTWIVWSARTEMGIKLHYAITRKGIIIQPPRMIETGMTSNVGPHLTFLKNGTPLVVWAGNNGDDDDIYSSSWNGKRWTPPQRLHANNGIPDYLPKIIVDQRGESAVRWFTIGPEGQFVIERSLENALIKSMELTQLKTMTKELQVKALNRCLAGLPAEIKNPELSTINFLCEGEDASQQIKFVGRFFSKF